MAGENRIAHFRERLSIMRTRLGVGARSALLVFAALIFWSAASHAATITNVSALTIPPAVLTGSKSQADAAVLGPQSLQINAANTYTAPTRIGVEIDISNASFVISSTPTITGLTSCAAVVPLTTKIILDGCTASGGVFQFSGISYNNASALAAGGTSITLSGLIYNSNNPGQIFETITATPVATNTAVSYTLATNTAGAGSGTISASPQATSYNAGTTVTLTATPASGSTFAGWSGGCSGTATTCQVTMNANQTVTATYDLVVSATPYTLTTSTAGTGAGTVSASPQPSTYATGGKVISGYAAGTAVTLTATPASGSTFAGWSGGGCSGAAATCQVTMSANQTVIATFNTAGGYTLTTSYSGSGTGLVAANPAATSYAAGTVVTLTATATNGSAFASWSGGGCSGAAATCQVTMNANQAVTATFNADGSTGGTLRQGAVFSSVSPASQSFLRFYNAGTAPGTVTVTLSDYTSGQTLGQWNSPTIAAGTAPQYPISTVESALTSGVTRPAYYSVTMQSQFAGTFQHVLWKPSDGTLTNLSTCDSGITAIPARVANVHSSALGSAGYPSSVVIYNTGATAMAATLTLFDAATGKSLGAYSTSTIPANGEQILMISTLEATLGITVSSSIPHYIVTMNAQFTGHMQHLVNNTQVGVITDMSTVCSFPTSTKTQTPPPGNPSDLG